MKGENDEGRKIDWWNDGMGWTSVPYLYQQDMQDVPNNVYSENTLLGINFVTSALRKKKKNFFFSVENVQIN